jgi:hypothetical protein
MKAKLFALFLLSTIFLISLASALTWTSNLNDGLIDYWGFNENSGTTVADEVGENDLEFVVDPQWVSDGISGSGLYLDHESFVQNLTPTFAEKNPVNDFTASIWFRLNGTCQGDLCPFFQLGGSAPDPVFLPMLHQVHNKLYWITQGGGANELHTDFIPTNELWYNVVFTKSGSVIKTYVNGELNGTGVGISLNPLSFILLGYYTTSAYFNGTIDEVAFWNRTLSDEEIMNLSTGITHVPNDLVPPTLSITYPQSTTYNVNVSQLDYAYSDANAGSCWYSTDSGATNSSEVLAGVNFTEVTSVEGYNIWTLYCEDNSENLNSTFVTFFKDTTNPLISIVYPQNITYNSNVTELNYIYSDINPADCWYSTDNGATNSSPVLAGTNFTGLVAVEEGNTWIVYCNDSYGNQNSNSITFSKETILPEPPLFVVINSPQNIIYSTSSILFNFSLSDDGYCEYTFDDGVTNYSMTANPSNTEFTSVNPSIPNGNYTLRAYCNDSEGDTNYTEAVIFGKNYIAPVIPETPSTTGSAIYSILEGSGAGLGIFIQILAKALPVLLIGIALVGIFVLVGYGISQAVKHSLPFRK